MTAPDLKNMGHGRARPATTISTKAGPSIMGCSTAPLVTPVLLGHSQKPEGQVAPVADYRGERTITI